MERSQEQLVMLGNIIAQGIDQLESVDLPDWAVPEKWSCTFTMNDTGKTWTVTVKPGESA